MSFWSVLVRMNVSIWYFKQWRLIKYWYPQIASCVNFNEPDRWHREIAKIIDQEFIRLNKGTQPELGLWEALIHLVLAKQAWARSEFKLTMDIATRMQEVLDKNPTIFSAWLVPHAKAWQAIGALMTASCMEGQTSEEKEKLKILGMFWANTAIRLDSSARNKWFNPDKLLLSTTVLKTMPENEDASFWGKIQHEAFDK